MVLLLNQNQSRKAYNFLLAYLLHFLQYHQCHETLNTY
jgi:hypothetical protein